jgi:predicted AlkP superfamily pyrophosphatase or phosphodiesterase
MKYAFTFLVTVSLTVALLAQTSPKKTTATDTRVPEKPKLIIGIVVDQMRHDYIYRFWDKFGNDGFKRLVNQGYNCKNTNYNYMPTYTGPGHASIYTGTTPSVHGIIANEWYDRELRRSVYCAEDKSVRAVGSAVIEEGQRSPSRMISTTMGDQLRLATSQQSKVIGLALKDRSAILPAGHSANASYWYDGSSGNMITSTYYASELPKWVNEFNARQLPKKYLSQDWDTIPGKNYKESIADNNPYEGVFVGESKPTFPHKLASLMDANGKLGMIRNTPYGNNYTEDFAEATILGEQLGKGTQTDFLCVSFSSTDYIGHMYGPQSMEIEDCYIRMDQTLAKLFQFLDNYLGKNNVLIFLTADHGAVDTPQYLKDQKIPAGYFDEKKVSDSLSRTLIRKYGDTLLASYENDQAFLNHQKINAKGLNKKEVEDFTADFLMRFKGVASCMKASDLLSNEYARTPYSLVQNGYNFKRSGDVCVILEPGWFSEWSRKTGTTHGTPWTYDTHVPLLFWGWKVKTGFTESTIHITDIAPTICNWLNIQNPDGCTGTPISGMLK